MTEERKENPPCQSGIVQSEAVQEPSSKETEGVTRRRVLKGAAAVSAAVAVTYAPPSLRRIAMPSALAKVSPGKEDGEKDPAGDKTGDKTTDKDPNADKDPEEKTKEGKETKESKEDKETKETKESGDKDPTSDKNPFEKDPNEKDPTTDKPYETSQNEISGLPKFVRTFFDEWS